jgi:hypothetical protein
VRPSSRRAQQARMFGPAQRAQRDWSDTLHSVFGSRTRDCARGRCTLHAFLKRRDCGGGDAKSSVRSAMFIARRAARPAKLRRNGMYSRSLGPCRKSRLVLNAIHAAPTELGWIRRAGCYKHGAPNGAWPACGSKDRVRCSGDERAPREASSAIIELHYACIQGRGG